MVKTPEAMDRLAAPDDDADGLPDEHSDERLAAAVESPDAAETSESASQDGVPDDEVYTVIEMFGHQVRISRDDATHWGRFHDAPDEEWYSWRIDWTVPGGRLVRR